MNLLFFWFSNLRYMQFFSVDATIFKKEKLTYFLAPENMKKHLQKLLILGPPFFLFSIGPKPAQISFSAP